ncbi:MAG: inorganic phosphate transporter [Rikenellaceae bacterium]
MDPIYYVIIAILAALAVSDLIVGVSNDAVNFLNSAIGSKAAPRWVIMTVASVGILLGSVFSSGMMEVARSGIFFPGQFDFHSVMMIFLAVMFTDVILLDTFNTFGLPTSTTVSLVFELLGSAVAVALVTMWSAAPDVAATLSSYINSSKALSIISGILLSVVISFTVGMIVMFVTRAIFSFRYKKTFSYIGAIWCGIALTAISYFAVFKGLKGSSIMPADLVEFINSTSTMAILVCSFVFWTIFMYCLQLIFRLNILKLTVLCGTFSLALAFAGNDLVNFIGVSMAGWSTVEIGNEALAAGADLSTLKMGALAEKVQVNWIFLFAAGAIMTLTLWFSKKARKVTETEINLSRQGDGSERFGSTLVSRGLVRSAMKINKAFTVVTPKPMQRWLDRRFEPVVHTEADQAPFDLIRATVNLATASILIALATSLKLPLSTTYVTFMVAMGSSLSDRAWGRDSAVYRITGVLTVISGWFLTAFIAFTVAFVVALTLMYGGVYAIVALAILCAYMLWHSSRTFKKKAQKEAEEQIALQEDAQAILTRTADDISEVVAKVEKIYEQSIYGTFNEDLRAVKKAHKSSKKLHEEVKERKQKLHFDLSALQSQDVKTAHHYVQVVDYLGEMAKGLLHITRPAVKYIENNHAGFGQEQLQDLKKVMICAAKLNRKQADFLANRNFKGYEESREGRQQFIELLNEVTQNQIKRIMEHDSNERSSMLFFEIINETKILFLQTRNMMDSQRNFLDNKAL